MPSYKQSKPQDDAKAWAPGEYLLEIIDAEEKESKQGNDMIVLKCKVVKDGEPLGAKIVDHLVFTPKAVWKVDTVRAAIGEDVVPDEEIEVTADDFVGKRGRAILKIREDDDRWNEIERWVTEDVAEAPAPKGASPAPTKDGDIPF